MKLILIYALGLSLVWLGLISLLAGLEAWPRDGAFMPVGVGALLLLAAARFFLSYLRLGSQKS